ncbi:hypothetical protein V6Z11_D13G204500 [Gossypium hirsutum]
MELVRVCLEEKNDDISSVPPASTRAILVEKGTGLANDESSKITRSMSMRRRPWINYGQYDNSSEDEPDHGKLNQVTARWRPEEACRPDIEDVPVFYPTDEVLNVAYNILSCLIFLIFRAMLVTFACKI